MALAIAVALALALAAAAAAAPARYCSLLQRAAWLLSPYALPRLGRWVSRVHVHVHVHVHV